MRTVFSREDPEAGHIVYNRTLLEFARHYGYLPKACKPYRAKTKGKVERPFRQANRTADSLDRGKNACPARFAWVLSLGCQMAPRRSG
jgi:transposase